MEGDLGKQPSGILESNVQCASQQPAGGNGHGLHQAVDQAILPFKSVAEEPHIYFK